MWRLNIKLSAARAVAGAADLARSPLRSGGTAAAAPTAVQACQPCPLLELSPSHPILL